jgi:hypothetical protein
MPVTCQDASRARRAPGNFEAVVGDFLGDVDPGEAGARDTRSAASEAASMTPDKPEWAAEHTRCCYRADGGPQGLR